MADLRVRKTFMNELRNQIEVQVILTPRKGCDALRLTITGPYSKSDNFITRREAEILRDALNEVLPDGAALGSAEG